MTTIKLTAGYVNTCFRFGAKVGGGVYVGVVGYGGMYVCADCVVDLFNGISNGRVSVIL